jgi:hypothetical protein
MLLPTRLRLVARRHPLHDLSAAETPAIPNLAPWDLAGGGFQPDCNRVDSQKSSEFVGSEDIIGSDGLYWRRN